MSDKDAVQTVTDNTNAYWVEPSHCACPNCGYCPHCGRGGRYWPEPYWPSPYWPTCPPYIWTVVDPSSNPGGATIVEGPYGYRVIYSTESVMDFLEATARSSK